MNPRFFITGIGTEVGKTIVSALLVKALEADYWKPVQSGDLHFTDSQKVQRWVGEERLSVFPETYRLHHPLSPHAAAALDGVEIQLEQFRLPETQRPLIVEGAGGLLVPLNQQHTMLDLIGFFQLPVVLVSRHYLGSINHTLLSIEALQRREIPIAALIFNGPENQATEQIIEQFSGIQPLFRIEEMDRIDAETITGLAGKWSETIREALLNLF